MSKCQSCKYWIKQPGPIVAASRIGVCRRFPPTMMLVPGRNGGAEIIPVWANTGDSDVCGEHSPKVALNS